MSTPPAAEPTLGVVIASAGRARVLGETLQHFRAVAPQAVLAVSVPDQDSLPAEVPAGVLVDVGIRGAAAQRNAAIGLLPPSVDLVLFFDDDALPHSGYAPAMSAAFQADPALIAATGRVLRDGALVGEIEPREAVALLDAADVARTGQVVDAFTLYGCNFAVRRSALALERFDERLPLYSWLEDLDLSQRLKRHGRLGRAMDAVCVHLGTRSGGRASHLRLGYSQIVNAVYLRRKRSISPRLTAKRCAFALGGNAYHGLRGPDRIGRLRRLRGNLIGVADVVRGRVTPERILELTRG